MTQFVKTEELLEALRAHDRSLSLSMRLPLIMRRDQRRHIIHGFRQTEFSIENRFFRGTACDSVHRRFCPALETFRVDSFTRD